MPLFANATPFDADVEKATHEMNTTEDWSLILDICEKVARQPNGPRDCLKSIVKRLNHKVPFVSMQALTLLDACVNNCGHVFHLEICSRDFVSECRTLISQKAHPKVAHRLRLMIKTWSEMAEFKDDSSLNLIPSFYESLKKEGFSFSETEPKSTPDPTQAKKEEDDLAKAIALSLQENEGKSGRLSSGGSVYPQQDSSSGSSALYPSALSSSSRPVQKEIRKVRALYEFEAAEDNELTFKAGELICVLDDSDPNWWKGSNHRGEGLFPANFVTADLTAEPEPEIKTEKKTVQFNEEVEVKTVQLMPGEMEINESKIDEVLTLIQNADPTGETRPDGVEMLTLEEQCKGMGPLIDAELEKVDRSHANLVELNKKVMDALQMYHSLMKETPAYGYAAMKTQAMNPQMYVPVSSGVQPPHVAPAMYNNQGPYPNAGPLPPTVPGMPVAGINSMPTQQPPQSFSQPQPVQSSQPSMSGAHHMADYSSATMGVMPNMSTATAPNGNQTMYAQGPPPNMAMYQHAPPQQPLL